MKKQRKLKVLSIDFDYFQNVDKSTLLTCYPDGIDLPTTLSSIVWAGYYATPSSKSQLMKVTILQKELNLLKQILLKNTKASAPVMITNSHVHIYNFIHEQLQAFQADSLNVVNIDMHHDMFNDNKSLDCGNWVSHIHNEYPNACNISWIANPTALDCYGLSSDGITHIYTSIDAIKDCKFDIVFLCRSDNWLAPHLDAYFEQLVQFMNSCFHHILIETAVMTPRQLQEYSDAIEATMQQIHDLSNTI